MESIYNVKIGYIKNSYRAKLITSAIKIDKLIFTYLLLSTLYIHVLSTFTI